MAREQSMDTVMSKYKIGDVVCGVRNCYGIYPHFYKIVGFKGKKTVLLEEMNQASRPSICPTPPTISATPPNARTPRSRM